MTRLSRLCALLSAALLVVAFSPSSTQPQDDAEHQSAAPIQAQGTLVPVGQKSLGKMKVTVFAPGDTSSTITSDGSFSLGVGAEEDTLKVQIDAPASEERAFHPALFRASSQELESGITVFMIPRQWEIQNGKYAGETVSISLYRALSSPEDARGLYLGGFIDPGIDRFFPNIFHWKPEDKPIPVAFFNKTPNHGKISSKDSTAFWDVLEEMESVMGRDLFDPATAEELNWTDPENYPDEAIGVVADTSAPCATGTVVGKEPLWKWPVESTRQSH